MRVVDLIDFTPYHYQSTYTKVSTRQNFQNENIWRRSLQEFCPLVANETVGLPQLCGPIRKAQAITANCMFCNGFNLKLSEASIVFHTL